MIGRGDLLHLVLFDFSLSRTPPENVEAGTKAYLDPFLPLRKHWDLYAERYSAAVTLFEMTPPRTLPIWGDGQQRAVPAWSARPTLDGELFDPALREQLVPFPSKKPCGGMPANVSDNAEVMLQEWRECFKALLGPPDAGSETSTKLNCGGDWRKRPSTRRSTNWALARGQPTPWTGPTC